MPSGSSAKYLVTVSAHGTTKVCDLDARLRTRVVIYSLSWVPGFLNSMRAAKQF